MALTLQQLAEEVREGLDSKLHVRGKSLDVQIRKAGRLLPRRVRRAATYIAQAVALTQNPKLAKMVDMAKVRHAHRLVMDHLESVDLGAQRRDAALNLIASIAFALLVTGVLLLFVLWQRGFV